ncbi:hypothetical protein [Kitasatospora purpeofusca]|uniref:restriction endonuclease subunit S n=1 Tax=Kitasatospora purpeofusca TaxID=67352 RepID=UPI002250623A|nr:hypothetical protein [Kitasatospora purpeofusca]MCX4752542.1 hypothetical protein [Kitasatospora purpeofusca]WSR32112.1 hypothetical protein OG715_14615 [Kitasatospora purpeofusca]
MAQRSTLRAGDVLMTEGGDLDKLGRGTIWREELDGCLHQNHVFALRTDPRRLDAEYLAWVTQSAYARRYFESTGTKTTNLASTSSSKILDFRVPLPELSEQRRISEFLDFEVARVDRLVSARQKQVGVLDELEYAEVTDGLIPGSLTSASGEWPWAWLPAQLDGSSLVRLGYVARVQSGLTVDGKRDVSGDVVTRPYLRVANVQADRILVDNVSEITVPPDIAKRSTLLPGDVLMTEGGDLDKLGRGTVWHGELKDCLHQNHVFAVRPDVLRLDADYLSLMTRTLHGRCYFESTGVKTTNLASTNSSKILGFPIPLPNVETQRVRVLAVQRQLDGIARARRRLQEQLELLTERRQALITAAVTGQLDVTTARPTHDRDF